MGRIDILPFRLFDIEIFGIQNKTMEIGFKMNDGNVYSILLIFVVGLADISFSPHKNERDSSIRV